MGHKPRTSRILTALVEIVASHRARLLEDGSRAGPGCRDSAAAAERRVDLEPIWTYWPQLSPWLGVAELGRLHGKRGRHDG